MSSIEDLLQQESKDIVKGHIRKIVEIYGLEWRVLHELIQNAVDAIQVDPEPSPRTVNVDLNVDDDYIEVKDTGKGFKKDLSLLCPGGTGEEKRLSSRSPTKGYQGVGLKAVMFSTDHFEIESRTNEKYWQFKAARLRKYIQENEDVIPEYESSETINNSGNTFTRVKATFPDSTISNVLSKLTNFYGEDSVRWKDLYWKERDEMGREPWEVYLNHFFSWYFRTQSYIGCVNSLLNVPVKNAETEEDEPIKNIDIEFKIEGSEDIHEIKDPLGKWLGEIDGDFTCTIPYESWDYEEVANENLERAQKYRIAPNIVKTKPSDDEWEDLRPSFKDQFLDLKLTPNKRADNFRDKYEEFLPLIERKYSSIDVEDYEKMFEYITGIYLAIGRTSYFEQLGLQNHGLRFIASQGTPTAHSLSVRSTSSTWYENTIHMIINVDDNLNIGKRHLVNGWLVGRINDFMQAAYPSLVKIAKLFVRKEGTSRGEESIPEVIEDKTINREGISFRRFPIDENSLIGLFSQAIQEIMPDFDTYGYFSSATYDGKFLWSDSNPQSDADLLKLEFKLDLDRLVNEFQTASQDKEFTDVDLVIVWDRDIDTSSWSVKGLSQSRSSELERIYEGIPVDILDHVLEDNYGNYCPLISVADLLTDLQLEDDKDDDLDSFVAKMG